MSTQVRSRPLGAPRALRQSALILTTALLSLLLAPLAVLGPLAAAPLETTAPPETPTATARPNILIVVTDDQPVGMMSAMPRTTQWLASGGVDFRNAIAPTPLCCPARATIMSGRYAHNHGVQRLNEAPARLDFDRTIQARLRAVGYRTAMAGKLFSGWPAIVTPPAFDRFAHTIGDHTAAYTRFDPSTAEGLGFPSPTVSNAGSQPDVLGDSAEHWIEEFAADGDDPWLIYLAPSAPHAPYTLQEGTAPAMPVTRARAKRDVSDKPPHIRDVSSRLRTGPSRAWQWKSTYRMLRPVDTLMGRLQESLAATGQLENTLVIFTSDNGFLYGEHRTRNKREPYDGSVRVPLLLSWPAGSAASGRPQGRAESRIASLVDIAPTVYDAAGIDPGYPVDGQSLLGPATRQRALIEHVTGGPHSQDSATWQGWWRPGAMYRRAQYAQQGTAGCHDTRPVTFCQRYAALPGHEESYDDARQLQNRLRQGADSSADRSWTDQAASCLGTTCHALEQLAPATTRRPWVRVTVRTPRMTRDRWQVRSARRGHTYVVDVVARNLSGRALWVRPDLGRHPRWKVAKVSRGGTLKRLRPGQRYAVRYRVRFQGTGMVLLPGTVQMPGQARSAWASAPIRVR